MASLYIDPALLQVDRQPPAQKRPIAVVDRERPKAKIFAAGCNAWSSLNLNQEYPATGGSEGGPPDIYDFKPVCECDSVSDLRAFLSWTTCNVTHLLTLGYSYPNISKALSMERVTPLELPLPRKIS